MNETSNPSARICVIGAGGHSQYHGQSLARLRHDRPESVELAAVCDLDDARASKYAAEYGFARTYKDYFEMLEREKPDGVLVIVAPKLLRRIGGDVLEGGFNALIEKPPGWSSAETAELAEIAARQGVKALVSFNRRFGPAMIRAREWLDGVREKRPPEIVLGRLVRNNRVEDVYSTGIHVVDAVMSLVGSAEVVSVAAERSPGRRDNAGARLLFDNGVEAQCVWAFNGGHHDEVYEVIGGDYHVRVDLDDCRLMVWEKGDVVLDWQMPDDMPLYEKNGTLGETVAFAELARTGVASIPDLRDGLRAVRVAEAVRDGGVVVT